MSPIEYQLRPDPLFLQELESVLSIYRPWQCILSYCNYDTESHETCTCNERVIHRSSHRYVSFSRYSVCHLVSKDADFSAGYARGIVVFGIVWYLVFGSSCFYNLNLIADISRGFQGVHNFVCFHESGRLLCNNVIAYFTVIRAYVGIARLTSYQGTHHIRNMQSPVWRSANAAIVSPFCCTICRNLMLSTYLFFARSK